ncbi:MAG: Gfo/Idh/MocA family oxidoreductase, partial [Verrucomicrobiota bacterium]
MASPSIGFAIVGTGMIADVHAEAILHSPNARLCAVYSRGGEKCREFAQKHGCKAVGSLEELIADPEIRAVCVTTPSGAHAEAAIPLLAAGKAVLCEKPLEVSLDAVDRILAAAEHGGGVLAGVFQQRLSRGANLLKKAIDAGRFGRLSLCSAYVKWWRAQSYYDSSAWKGTWKLDGGGALMNQGVHAVDLLQWLVGLPEEVCAFSATLAHHGMEAEDTVVATLRFPGGALGVIDAATSCYPGSDLRIEILGDHGSAVLVNDQLVRWEFAQPLPGDEEVLRPDEGPGIKGGTSDPKAISNEGHRRLVDDLAMALIEGRLPMIPGAEARRAVALVLAIYESARTGRATRV